MVKKILSVTLKSIAVVILTALLAIVITSISAVYHFDTPKPFSGKDIFNPYSTFDATQGWKRAAFHTHTRVEGPLNECEYTPAQTLDFYDLYGYDIVTFSNHNELTVHPTDSTLQVNLYEHGYNLFKYHKLIFGCSSVNRFDHLLPIFASQRQWQIDMLSDDADIIVINHPLRTHFTTKSIMQRLRGYHIIELDSGKSTENSYWDSALSAGKYSFGIANDDLHRPNRSGAIAVRSTFLQCPSGRYEDIKQCLTSGCYYAMRTPDYGAGDLVIKQSRNKNLPYIRNIGVSGCAPFIALSERADSIKVTGQDHTTLLTATATDSIGYAMADSEPYCRFTAYMQGGEVIYANPFARYDANTSASPLDTQIPMIDTLSTILFNLAVALLAVAVIALIYKTIW